MVQSVFSIFAPSLLLILEEPLHPHPFPSASNTYARFYKERQQQRERQGNGTARSADRTFSNVLCQRTWLRSNELLRGACKGSRLGAPPKESEMQVGEHQTPGYHGPGSSFSSSSPVQPLGCREALCYQAQHRKSCYALWTNSGSPFCPSFFQEVVCRGM